MNPICTSTPQAGVKRVLGRRSIHHKDIPSPVPPENPKNYKKMTNLRANIKPLDEETSENEETTSESSEETNDFESVQEVIIQNSPKINKSRIKSLANENCTKYVNDKHNYIYYYCTNYKIALSNFIYISIIIIGLMLSSNHIRKNTRDGMSTSFSNIKATFPSQTEDFWHYITSNIREVQLFNKPSIILFLYLKHQESKSNDLITHISQLASKWLNGKSNAEPIILDGFKLNTLQYLKDYGILIDDYRHALESRHVMVVRNLENVRSRVSQAFHVICDEYTPLVGKAFIIFSVKVPRFTGKETEQAGNVLRKVWNDLDEDRLEPLIARVTNLVLKLNLEI